MKNIFILSTLEIYRGTNAGAGRMMNIAQSLAMQKNRVFLCSAMLSGTVNAESAREVIPNVLVVGEKKASPGNGIVRKILKKIGYLFFIAFYLNRLSRLLRNVDGEKIIYLYPTNFISMDVACLLFFKVLGRYRIYYDVNEIRRLNIQNRTFSRSFRRIFESVAYVVDYGKYTLVEWLMRYYDGIVAISTNIENYVKRYNRRVLRVPILSDTSEKLFSEAPKLRPGERFRICFTGMVTLKKEGFDLLYEALAGVKSKFDDFELHLYGPVSSQEKGLLLKNLPREYGMEGRIIYHGLVPREEIIREMQKSHLLIIPRPLNPQTKYGFSTKLSEYLVSGVPVLVTDVSDNSLYLEDGRNGFIVQPGNVDEMTEKILFIIRHYRDVAEKVVQRAFETAREHFHYGNYGETLTEFLK